MKKRARLFTLIALTLLSSIFFTNMISSQSIDSSIKKMTYTAEQYETGSLNYAQLIVSMASLSKELASELGASSQDHDQVLNTEQLERALGKPTESTKWVWVEGEEREKKLDSEIPAWRKIIFDGKETQIYLTAWPSIPRGRQDIVYHLHQDIIFKSNSQEVDIESEIEKMKSLAQQYSSNPSSNSLEELAEESVNIEQAFNNNPYKNSLKCEANMNNLFGSENKRDSQKILAQEIEFADGEKFQAKIRLEICDDCDWHWINMNMWIDSRGNFQQPEENRGSDFNRQQYESYTSEDFKNEIQKVISEAKSDLQTENLKQAVQRIQELRPLMDIWNEKSNNVWEQFQDQYKVDFETMTQEEREKCSETYCWIIKDQERINAENSFKDEIHEERKQFFLNLFLDYEKKESYFSQEQWEKRLFEQFKDFGQEICTNNLDDNNNQQIDCGENQCSGKVCGSETISTIDETGQTVQQIRDLYCTAGICQAKLETLEATGPICGNNICEENEIETCSTDCAICTIPEAISCDGIILFSGQDANSCPLAPVCLTEQTSCETDNDCVDPLCGDSSCIQGTCQLGQLTECREAECTDGEEKRISCISKDRLVSEICIQGIWRKTNIQCPVGELTDAPVLEESELESFSQEVIGNACTVKSDCGNENDVCSNGICVTLPETIKQDTTEEIFIESEAQEEQSKQEETSSEQETQSSETNEPNEQSEEQIVQSSPEEEPTITGNAVSYFFKSLISGFQIESDEENGENSGGDNQDGESSQDTQNNGETQQQSQEGQVSQSPPNEGETDEERENRGREERESREDDDRQRREKEDGERRKNECTDRCDKECYDRKIRPFTEQCIREECGQELECNVDEVRQGCEVKAESETDVASCINDCSTKCLTGENTWIEPDREEHKEEKFVFTVGGACRQEKDRVDESIWFGGWGDEFKDFQIAKEKYYNSGGADWCKREYENLIKQRIALEESLNEEFASWFFEDYVASSAGEWENHISGIFDLYWRDVDLSRQLVERSACLGSVEIPKHNLINLEYKTDYGSIKLWEEIKTAKISNDLQETEIISPYMETYLFPSRDFYILEMKKAMESHRIPGQEGKESSNFLNDEQKQRLIEEGILDEIKEFNEKFGESLIIQFKDYNKNEIVFNVFVKVNPEDLLSFEPMLYSETISEDVKIEFDVEKLLDIIEYGESDRVELQSPPWDKQQEVGFVNGAIDGVKMYFMFRELLNSGITSKESAEDHATFFTRIFFEVVMGDQDRQDEENQDDSNMENFEQRDSITGEIIAQY